MIKKSTKYCLVGFFTIFFACIFAAFILFAGFRYWTLIKVPTVGNLLAYTTMSDPVSARYELAFMYFDTYNNDRDLNKAIDLLNMNKEDERSQYLLARAYFGIGNVTEVISVGNSYLEKFPDNKRMHYVRGLANAYAKEWEAAEEDFKKFIDYDPNEWAGYLDLSWVYFQTGRMSDARMTIEKGSNVDPTNPWISAAYGIVLFNQSQSELASFKLKQALKQADELSFERWAAAYSSTGVSVAREELEQFKEVIKFNLKLVEDFDSVSLDDIQSVYDVRFADPSQRGIQYGLHVSACNGTCPACNICGDCQGTGVTPGERYAYHSNASCAPPALPSDQGDQCESSRNICGQYREGVMSCGVCDAVEVVKTADNVEYYEVPHTEEVYVYVDNGAVDSDFCHLLTNQSGANMFVPVKSSIEYNNFIASQWVDENVSVELIQLSTSTLPGILVP